MWVISKPRTIPFHVVLKDCDKPCTYQKTKCTSWVHYYLANSLLSILDAFGSTSETCIGEAHSTISKYKKFQINSYSEANVHHVTHTSDQSLEADISLPAKLPKEKLSKFIPEGDMTVS